MNNYFEKLSNFFSKSQDSEETQPLKETILFIEEKVEKDESKQVFFPIHRPQMFRNDYTNPKSIGDLVDDVILYILSYLEVNDLITVGLLNHNWRKISENDSLWESIYNQHIWWSIHKVIPTEQFKYYYIKALQKEKTMDQALQSIERKENVTKISSYLLRGSYGLILPSIFMIGMIILTIIVIFIIEFDGSFNLLWISLILVFTYLLIVFCLGLDTYGLLSLMKNYSEEKRDLFNSSDETLFESDKTDHDSVLSSNLFVWGVAWLPLSILCFLIKLTIFPKIEYTTTFIPVHFLSLIYSFCNIFMIRECTRCFKKKKVSSSIFIYLIMIAINIWVSLQLFLIGMRLDKILNSNWGVIFIPTWITLITLFCCALPLGCLAAGNLNSSTLTGWILFLFISPCFLCSIILFFILLILKIEGFLYLSIVFVFIPCVITEFVFCICLFSCSIASLINGFYTSH